MGSCCSSSGSAGSVDDNEVTATAVQEQADQAAAVPRCPTPLHMPAAARHATDTEPPAKIGLSQTAAEAAAASSPGNNLVTDTLSIAAEPLVDGVPSFWSRKGGSDGGLIEGEVEIHAGPSDTSQGDHTLQPCMNAWLLTFVLYT